VPALHTLSHSHPQTHTNMHCTSTAMPLPSHDYPPHTLPQALSHAHTHTHTHTLALSLSLSLSLSRIHSPIHIFIHTISHTLLFVQNNQHPMAEEQSGAPAAGWGMSWCRCGAGRGQCHSRGARCVSCVIRKEACESKQSGDLG
jgi:hypothetical protein